MDLEREQKEIKLELERLARQYHCDPMDPIFGLLEKVIEIRNEVRFFKKNQIQEEARNTSFSDEFKAFSKESEAFKKNLNLYQNENQKAEKLLLHSTQSLMGLARFKWTERLFSAFIGFTLPAFFLILGLGWFYFYSLESQLRKLNIALQVKPLKHSTQVTLIGGQLLKAEKIDQQVWVEFKKE